MTLKSLLWHPGFGEGRGPCRSAQRICPVFLTGFVSVRAGALYLLSAFYFQKRIPCLLVHSRCSVFIQCVKDRKVLGSLKFALGSALLISLYLCRFNFFLFSADVHAIFKAQSKAWRHSNKHRFLLSRNSYSRFPSLGFLECSWTTSTLSIVCFHFKEKSCNLHSKAGHLPIWFQYLHI